LTGKHIHQIELCHNDFTLSIIGVVEILSENNSLKRYWNDLKKKKAKEGSQAYEKIVQLKMGIEDGKMRAINVADPETLLSTVRHIPLTNAESFKLHWQKMDYKQPISKGLTLPSK